MPRIYVGIGSNSDPAARLRQGVAQLEHAFGAVRCSAVFRSAAVGSPAPDYLNLVVALDSDREAAAVKSGLVAIEDASGRRRGEPRAPLCSLDLDLLLYGDRVDAAQRLPHADVLRRAFVLAPLADVAPDLAHPVTGERLADAWRRLQATGAKIENVGLLARAG